MMTPIYEMADNKNYYVEDHWTDAEIFEFAICIEEEENEE